MCYLWIDNAHSGLKRSAVFTEKRQTNHRQETYKSGVVSKTVNLDAQQPLAILCNAEVFEYKLSGEQQSELLSL